MKHPHLPQYFAIKRDENNPLWEEYKSFVRSNVGDEFDNYFSGWEYIGFNGNDHFNGFVGTSDLAFSFREMDIRIITLSEWKQAIDKTEDMKETELQSVPAPEFDPSKEWEISNDNKTWFPGENYDFIGFHNKKPVVFWKSDNRIVKYLHIRNIEPFTAGMLEVGEWMEVEKSEYESCPKGTVVARGRNDVREIKTGKEWSNNEMHFIWGKRVKVNITTEEI